MLVTPTPKYLLKTINNLVFAIQVDYNQKLPNSELAYNIDTPLVPSKSISNEVCLSRNETNHIVLMNM
jgi:hypothetical protein